MRQVFLSSRWKNLCALSTISEKEKRRFELFTVENKLLKSWRQFRNRNQFFTTFTRNFSSVKLPKMHLRRSQANWENFGKKNCQISELAAANFRTKTAWVLTFSVQKMFGTFYLNITTENAFSNILKSFDRIAKPKYLLHGVSARAKISLRQKCFCLVFHRFALLSDFFSCFKINENSSSAQIIFSKNSVFSKAFNKNFSRLFSNYFRQLIFQQTIQAVEI